MNLIKNFFHAFGDIIFGLAVVGIAVFLIGVQINADFDVFALGTKAYETVTAKFTKENSTTEPAEILSEPSSDGEPATQAANNAEPATMTADNTPAAGENANETPVDATKVVPEEVPAIRNIQISPGSTADEVASGLFANGVIGSKEEFLAEYARLPVGKTIKSGEFAIPSGSTPAEILAIIAP